MNRIFKYKYIINRKFIKKTLFSDLSPKAILQSTLIPTGMFLIAWYLGKIESQPFGYFCFACGIALLIWIEIQKNKLVKQTFLTLIDHYHSEDLSAEIEIDEEKINYSIWNKEDCVRQDEYLLSNLLMFSRQGKLMKIVGRDDNTMIYVMGQMSELTNLAEFLKSRGIEEMNTWPQTITKLVSLGLIVISFSLAVISFFPTKTDAIKCLLAWEEKDGYTVNTDWENTKIHDFGQQTTSVWSEGDTLYRIEQAKENEEIKQVELSCLKQGKEKTVQLDSSGSVKQIEEKDTTKSRFFLQPVLIPCSDAFLWNNSEKIELNPSLSWKRDKNQILGSLEDSEGFAQIRINKEKEAYTQEQLDQMDMITRMNLFMTSRIVPQQVSYTFTVQDGFVQSISFDISIKVKNGREIISEEEQGTVQIKDLSCSPSLQKQVETVFDQSIQHGDKIDLDIESLK
ncbi:hypothetical protein [uncultured Dubosiella sp.]|uniref:hypothetical protein n=1 Tax=uncultured Dubosiella sp. TaxID=1937011 RepID=UPI002730D72D|nr:hypothetical protein [uncultured Dubosiella sp.]